MIDAARLLLCWALVSKARPVIPGAVVFTTRAVHKRQLLLRPDDRLNQLIEYVYAVLVARYRILLHALCVMSNHTHDMATDPEGNIVDFRRDLHAILARAINSMYGDFDSLWSREPTCRVICVEPDDALDKIVYTMANPVSARLVAHGHSWPGVRGAWPRKARTIARPRGFFRDEADGGTWPETATLEFHRPPGHDDLSDEALAALIRGMIDAREETVRREVHASGGRFLGRRQVLAQPRTAYPSTSLRRFGLRPTVAARSKWARIEKLREDRDWLDRYEDAKARFRAGEVGVVFPYGTWKLKRYYRVACEGPPVSRLVAA